MKRIILALVVLASVASCKKDKNDPNCEKSVAGIAASYKITKATVKMTGFAEQDITTTFFDACELNGVYQLKSDKTVIYTETAVGCTGSGVGTWDVVAGNITIAFASGDGIEFPYSATTTAISGWDCNTLVLSEEPSAGQTYKYTFTKQ